MADIGKRIPRRLQLAEDGMSAILEDHLDPIDAFAQDDDVDRLAIAGHAKSDRFTLRRVVFQVGAVGGRSAMHYLSPKSKDDSEVTTAFAVTGSVTPT